MTDEKSMQNRSNYCKQKSHDNKKTPNDLHNDQAYESNNNIMPYSISLKMINKNAIIFYQNNV